MSDVYLTVNGANSNLTFQDQEALKIGISGGYLFDVQDKNKKQASGFQIGVESGVAFQPEAQFGIRAHGVIRFDWSQQTSDPGLRAAKLFVPFAKLGIGLNREIEEGSPWNVGLSVIAGVELFSVDRVHFFIGAEYEKGWGAKAHFGLSVNI